MANQIELEIAVSKNNEILKTDPHNVKVLIERGTAFRMQNNSAAALIDFNKALRLNPYSSHALNERAAMFLFQNNFDAEEKQEKYPDLKIEFKNKLALMGEFLEELSNQSANQFFNAGIKSSTDAARPGVQLDSPR